MKLLNMIKANTKVLEIGCATGYFTEELLKKNCRVWAIEKDKNACKIAKKIQKAKIINCAIENIGTQIAQGKTFDYIILADVLEHLADPLSVLVELEKYLKPRGKMLISLPNVANFSIRFNLFFLGKFSYQDFGILDKTHLHFFTQKTGREIINQAGFVITNFDVVAGFETSKIYKSSLGRIAFRISFLRQMEYFLTTLFPGLFALEFIYEAGN